MVSFKNTELILVGRNIKINTYAPPFKVTSNDFKEAKLLDFKDKIKIINTFPSLDTQVCDHQIKEFNKRALNLSKNIIIIPISKDLPFAQKRFCEFYNIQNIDVFSDYKTSSFGINYGILIKELNLLARSSVILDKNNVIRYIQVVHEITDSIDFDDLFNNLNLILKNPKISIEENAMEAKISNKCLACEGKAKPLSKNAIDSFLPILNSWQLKEDKKIVKEFLFKDFVEAKYFLDLIAIIADEQNHHPSFLLKYNKLKITMTTHAVGGLSINDFILAKMIDELKRW
jgi:thioredoxin-dependent peroxiredoxin